jgi:hypothetical protein
MGCQARCIGLGSFVLLSFLGRSAPSGVSLASPLGFRQARTGRGIHGLPKVSCRPAMPNPYTPCGRATLQIALHPFGGWPARRAWGLRPSSSSLDTPARVPHSPGCLACGLEPEVNYANCAQTSCVQTSITEANAVYFKFIKPLFPKHSYCILMPLLGVGKEIV